MRRSWCVGIVGPIFVFVGIGLSGCAAGQKRHDSMPVVQTDEPPAEKPSWRLFSWKWWPKTRATPAPAVIEKTPSDYDDVLTIGSLGAGSSRKSTGTSESPWPDSRTERLTRYFPTIGRRPTSGPRPGTLGENSAAVESTRDRGVRQAGTDNVEVASRPVERANQTPAQASPDPATDSKPVAATPNRPETAPAQGRGEVDLKVENIVGPAIDADRTPITVSENPGRDRDEPQRDARFGPSTDRTATLLGVKPAEPAPAMEKEKAEPTPLATTVSQPAEPSLNDRPTDSSIQVASADQAASSDLKPSLSAPNAPPPPPIPSATPKPEAPAPKPVPPTPKPAPEVPKAEVPSEPPTLIPAAPRAEDEPGAAPPPAEAKQPSQTQELAPPPKPVATIEAVPPPPSTAPAVAPLSQTQAGVAPLSTSQKWLPTSGTVASPQYASPQGHADCSLHEKEEHGWGLGLFSGKLLPCLKKKFQHGSEQPAVYGSAQSMFPSTYVNCEDAPMASPQGPAPSPQSVVACGKKKCALLEKCQLLQKIKNCDILAKLQNCPLKDKLHNCHLIQKVKDFKAQCKIKMCPCCSGGHKSSICQGAGHATPSPQAVPTYSSPQGYFTSGVEPADRSTGAKPRDLAKNGDVIERVSTDHVGEASQR